MRQESKRLPCVLCKRSTTLHSNIIENHSLLDLMTKQEDDTENPHPRIAGAENLVFNMPTHHVLEGEAVGGEEDGGGGDAANLEADLRDEDAVEGGAVQLRCMRELGGAGLSWWSQLSGVARRGGVVGGLRLRG
jgi:hypothetical protein